jgi:hypothetical protein
MSEREMTQNQAGTAYEQPEQQQAPTATNNFKQLIQAIDRTIPNYRTPDAMAFSLARRTPAVLVICFTVLLAGVIGSLLPISQVNFLWGIPSLGAIGLGVGLWVWSSNLVMRPDLSDDARSALKRAIRLQWSILAVGALAIIYFIVVAILTVGVQ